jgi:hypothetical protein
MWIGGFSKSQDCMLMETDEKLFGATMQEVGYLEVGFSFPCRGHYHLARHNTMKCREKDRQHGHIVFASDDGIAVVPACIFSVPFLDGILSHLLVEDCITEAQKQAVLALIDVRNLTSTLTAPESGILASGEALKIWTHYMFWGV